MSILPGFQKYKRHIRIGDDYILDSEWTHAKTVEMSDGSTLDDTVSNINREITATKKSVSDGKSAVASAITAQGVTTAADATFNVMAANIDTMATNKYNAGIMAADARTNVNSANYKAGYDAGVTAGSSGKYTLTQETKEITYIQNANGNNNYGSESITFNFNGNVAGIRNFSYNVSYAYTYLTNIVIDGPAVTLTLTHAHGINSSNGSGTLSVTVTLTVWYYK